MLPESGLTLATNDYEKITVEVNIEFLNMWEKIVINYISNETIFQDFSTSNNYIIVILLFKHVRTIKFVRNH